MTDEDPQFGYADEARRYRLESRIATGGMGEVWRATDTILGRSVAVKLLKSEYADNALFRTRFETEARHAASLHHPGVAAVYDFGEASAVDGSGVHRPFLVMELVDGQPLSALLLPGQPLDPEATRDLLTQAADALGAAHAAGIVHRDVKPANLLVTPDRQVKITDFGIARAAEGVGLTETGQVMGTPQYLSPEQAEGKSASPASDVYSLGVVAFECLAGRRPFVAESAIATALAHLREPVPDLPADIPADLAAVVRRSMSKSPAERYPDASAFAAALRDPATAATALVPPATATTQVLGGAATAAAAAAAAPLLAPTPVSGSDLGSFTDTGAPGSGPNGDRGRRWLPWVLLLVGLVAAAAVVFALTAGNGTDPTDEPTQPAPSSRPNAPSSTAPPTPTPTQEPSAPQPTKTRSTKPSPTPSETPSETTEPSPSVSEPPSVTPTTATPTAPTSTPPPEATPSEAASQPPATSGSTAPSTAPSAAPDSAPGSAPSASPAADTATRPDPSGKVTSR